MLPSRGDRRYSSRPGFLWASKRNAIKQYREMRSSIAIPIDRPQVHAALLARDQVACEAVRRPVPGCAWGAANISLRRGHPPAGIGCDSVSRHRTGQPAMFNGRSMPRRSAISRSLARFVAKKRPGRRPSRRFTSRFCQLWAVQPSRSEIPTSSAEIGAFPWRKTIKSHANAQTAFNGRCPRQPAQTRLLRPPCHR
jgi:hypothetical protein